MVILGYDSHIDESEERKRNTRRAKNEAVKLGNAADVIGILEGIPNIFSCKQKLWSERIKLLENNSVGRKYTDKIGEIQFTGKECVTDE